MAATFPLYLHCRTQFLLFKWEFTRPDEPGHHHHERERGHCIDQLIKSDGRKASTRTRNTCALQLDCKGKVVDESDD